MPSETPDKKRLGWALREQRQSRGLTALEVARKIGLATHKSITDIEIGARSLTEVELMKLLDLYGISYEALLQEEEDEILVRLRAEQETLPQEALQYLETKHSRIELLQDLRSIKAIKNKASWKMWIKPNFPIPTTQEEAIKQAEFLAESLRRDLLLGDDPITNILDIYSRLGLQVIQMPLGEKISGFIIFSNKAGPFVFINSKENPERRNFSMAHELCHFLADFSPSNPSGESPSKTFEPFENKYDKDYREIRANNFAAALLMPSVGLNSYIVDMLGRNARTINKLDIVRIHYHYRASVQAVLYRLKNLDLITKPNFEKLIQMAKLGDFEVKNICNFLGLPELSWDHLDPEKTLESAVRTTAVEAYLVSEISIGKLCEIFDHPVACQEELLNILQITRPKLLRPNRINPLLY